MLFMFLSFSVVPLFVDSTNYPSQTVPSHFATVCLFSDLVQRYLASLEGSKRKFYRAGTRSQQLCQLVMLLKIISFHSENQINIAKKKSRANVVLSDLKQALRIIITALQLDKQFDITKVGVR